MNEQYLEAMTGNDMVSGQAVRPRNWRSHASVCHDIKQFKQLKNPCGHVDQPEHLT